MIRWAALALGLALLTACGARPTGHGAPPYQEPTGTSSTPTGPASRSSAHASYADGQLQYTFPRLTGDDERALRAYVAFSVATYRTWNAGHAAPALRRTATPAVQQLVLKLAATERQAGVLDGQTFTQIRKVAARSGMATLTACIVHAGSTTPTASLLVRGDDGRWRVSATGPVHTGLENCA